MRKKVMDTANWPTDSDPIDFAAELNRLEPKKRARILQQMPTEMIDAVFWQLEPNDQPAVLDSVQHNQVMRLLENMAASKAVGCARRQRCQHHQDLTAQEDAAYRHGRDLCGLDRIVTSCWGAKSRGSGVTGRCSLLMLLLGLYLAYAV
jgi:Mg/Co/Ni transporter MgtE